MIDQVAFLTTEREHLFEMTRVLVRGMDLALFADPANPVQVVVNGSSSCGKKIIPDAAREVFFTDANVSFAGTPEYDEYWRGPCPSGQTGEIDFINNAWHGGYSQPFSRQKPWMDFLKQRQYGGINFVHNVTPYSYGLAGLDIYLSDYATSKLEEESSFLQAAFHRCGKAWKRYVVITVLDPRLQTSPSFQTALESLTVSARIGKTTPVFTKAASQAKHILQKLTGINIVDKAVPVFGQTIPRSLRPAP